MDVSCVTLLPRGMERDGGRRGKILTGERKVGKKGGRRGEIMTERKTRGNAKGGVVEVVIR